MAIDWTRFVEIVEQHQSFLLTSHIRPDGDALGSELGMAGILRALDKQVFIVNADATPPHLAFLDPGGQIRSLGQDVAPGQLPSHEVVIVLDTGAWAQLGPMADVVRETAADKVVVDHHVSADEIGAELFKDEAADSTGRLVLEAGQALGVVLTPEIARSLFAAMVTDTGWFRFNSTTGETLRGAAALVEAGAQPAEMYAQLYEQSSAGRVRLQGVILSRIVLELDGRLVHTHVLNEDFARAGALPSDTEDVVNMALAIAGTQFAVIFVEQPRGGCKISLRSRSQVDCSRIAERFGGGGHRAAAGASLPGPLAEVQSQVLAAVRAALA